MSERLIGRHLDALRKRFFVIFNPFFLLFDPIAIIASKTSSSYLPLLVWSEGVFLTDCKQRNLQICIGVIFSLLSRNQKVILRNHLAIRSPFAYYLNFLCIITLVNNNSLELLLLLFFFFCFSWRFLSLKSNITLFISRQL